MLICGQFCRRLLGLGLLLVILAGCGGTPIMSGTIYSDAEKAYRDASDQWVDYAK